MTPRDRRRRDGRRTSLTRATRHCLRPSSARPAVAFCAKGPVCRYCHAARGRDLSITSLRHVPRRLVAETWKRPPQLMDSFARGRAKGGGETHYACILCARVATPRCKLGITASHSDRVREKFRMRDVGARVLSTAEFAASLHPRGASL